MSSMIKNLVLNLYSDGGGVLSHVLGLLLGHCSCINGWLEYRFLEQEPWSIGGLYEC